MRRSAILATIALALLGPAVASAWTSGDEIPGAAMVDVTPQGLQQITALLPSLLPSEIVLGNMTVAGSGSGCSSYCYGLEIRNLKVGLAISDMTLVPRSGTPDGYLALDANATVAVNSAPDQFVIHGFLNHTTFGWFDFSVDCPMYVDPADVYLGADVMLAVKDDQLVPYLDASIPDVDGNGRVIEWQLTNVDIRGDCFVGQLFEVINYLGIDIEGFIISLAETTLNDQIQAFAPTIETTIEDAFAAASIEQQIPLGSATMDVSIHPDAVTIEDAGIRLSLAGSFASQTAPCVMEYNHFDSVETSGGDPDIGTAPSDVPAPFHAGILIDDDLINQALFAAYNGGVLCYTIGPDSGLPVNTALLGILSPTIGDLFPDSQPLTIVTRPAQVPVAKPVGDHDINIAVNELGVDFIGLLDYRNATILGADLDVDAGIDLALDANAGQLAISVPLSGDNLTTRVRLNEFAPGEDAAIAGSFGGLFDSIVGPLLDGLLGGLQFPLPTLAAGAANLGLTSLTVSPSGPDLDLFGLYANLGPVLYDNGAGCSGSGQGCSTGCGSTGTIVPVRAVMIPMVLAALALRRRRRSV